MRLRRVEKQKMYGFKSFSQLTHSDYTRYIIPEYPENGVLYVQRIMFVCMNVCVLGVVEH